MRYVLLIFMLVLLVCGEQKSGEPLAETAKPEGDTRRGGMVSDSLLLFKPYQKDGSTAYESVPVAGVKYPVSRKDALRKIGKSLSETCFASYGDRAVDVRFSVDTVKTVCAESGCLYIGLITIQDPDSVVFSTFFQGSTGASATFNTLTASFLQPQMNEPLLDAVAFTINGQFMEQLSHIDLTGIQVARLLSPRLQRQIIMRNSR